MVAHVLHAEVALPAWGSVAFNLSSGIRYSMHVSKDA